MRWQQFALMVIWQHDPLIFASRSDVSAIFASYLSSSTPGLADRSGISQTFGVKTPDMHHVFLMVGLSLLLHGVLFQQQNYGGI